MNDRTGFLHSLVSPFFILNVTDFFICSKQIPHVLVKNKTMIHGLVMVIDCGIPCVPSSDSEFLYESEDGNVHLRCETYNGFVIFTV